MTNVIKFEQKKEVFILRLAFDKADDMIVAFNIAYLELDKMRQLEHLVDLESKHNFVAHEIGFKECYPSQEDAYAYDNESYNDLLVTIAKKLKKEVK